MKKTASPYISIKRSRIHSKGVFAGKDIPKGTRIIEYVGEKITKVESDRRSNEQFEKAIQDKNDGAVYLFELNKRHDIDGNVPYNTARFINHSCCPNCETDIIRGKIWIIALRGIKKGAELTYNYGYDLNDYKDHKCNCGAPNCVGYILDEKYWKRLKRHKSHKRRRRR